MGTATIIAEISMPIFAIFIWIESYRSRERQYISKLSETDTVSKSIQVRNLVVNQVVQSGNNLPPKQKLKFETRKLRLLLFFLRFLCVWLLTIFYSSSFPLPAQT